jgi:hypothetical protein
MPQSPAFGAGPAGIFGVLAGIPEGMKIVHIY